MSLDEFDKISSIDPSIDSVQKEWAKFQVQVYDIAKKLIIDKVKAVFSPALLIKRERTRPDTLILWGWGNQIEGVIAINATIKYHLDDLTNRVKKLNLIKDLTNCPTKLSEMFYKDYFTSDSCYVCSICSRPIFIPIIVTREPYEGVPYSIVDKYVHLMDYDTYHLLLEKFDNVIKHVYPNQFIINEFKPTGCPNYNEVMYLSTIWKCVYTMNTI